MLQGGESRTFGSIRAVRRQFGSSTGEKVELLAYNGCSSASRSFARRSLSIAYRDGDFVSEGKIGDKRAPYTCERLSTGVCYLFMWRPFPPVSGGRITRLSIKRFLFSPFCWICRSRTVYSMHKKQRNSAKWKKLKGIFFALSHNHTRIISKGIKEEWKIINLIMALFSLQSNCCLLNSPENINL